MAVYLLTHGDGSNEMPAIRDLKQAIPAVIAVRSLNEIVKDLKKAKGSDPAIAIIALPKVEQAGIDELTKIAQSLKHELSIILVCAEEISASDYKQLLRNGIADWIPAKSGGNEILETIARMRNRGTENPKSSRRPITIAFVPSAGGVGNSTLLGETAVLLKNDKRMQSRRICLIDLDFQTSHICDYLDSEPRLLISELSEAPERLDINLFESFRTRHRSGIDILAAPRSKFPFESLNVRALDVLLSMAAEHYDLVLIDFPVNWQSWTAPVIAASDAVIVTGINTIPCLRLISETLASVRANALPALQVAVALNKCEYTAFGAIAQRKHAESALPDERLFFIGNRPEAIESVNMGIPMMLGAAARKIRKDLEQMATFCNEAGPIHGVSNATVRGMQARPRDLSEA
jgi:pilus assembly protein CpaE